MIDNDGSCIGLLLLKVDNYLSPSISQYCSLITSWVPPHLQSTYIIIYPSPFSKTITTWLLVEFTSAFWQDVNAEVPQSVIQQNPSFPSPACTACTHMGLPRMGLGTTPQPTTHHSPAQLMDSSTTRNSLQSRRRKRTTANAPVVCRVCPSNFS